MKELALRQFKLFLCLILILINLFPLPVFARTVDEINADLEKTQQEMEKIKTDLEKISQELKDKQTTKQGLKSEISKVQNELEIIEKSYDLLTLQKKELENEMLAKALEKEEKEKLQDEQVVYSYITWKTENVMDSVVVGSGDIVKNLLYYEFLTKETIAGVKTLGQQIEELNLQNLDFESQVKQKEAELKILLERKAFWQNQIKLSEESIASTKNAQNQLTSANNQLEAKQKEYNVELEKAIAEANAGSAPLVSGQLYFYGSVGLPRNRIECSNDFGIDPSTDAFGHGIGMSQWGAYGAANKGKNYNEILIFYYQGTSIQVRPSKMIRVNGYDKMSMEDYVSGLGEVPDKACGTMQKVEEWNAYADSQGWAQDDPKRQKYLIGGNCWPEEAIKAQVVAARTYAYNRADSICTSDKCQVYKGGFAKAWAAWETKDKVIINGDTVIDAFYSGFNSNGRGSANIETVWPKSSPRSYLVAVNDSAFAYFPKLCNQNYRRLDFSTNSFTIDDFQQMLLWAQEKSNWGDYNYIEPNYWNADVVRNQINNKIGSLKGIDVVNDASGRATKVLFVGSKGTGQVSGQFFRYLFSTWAIRMGRGEGIKSITYDIATAQ